MFETSMSGVFAIGDARQGSVKRVASAAGERAVCARVVHEYLDTHHACRAAEALAPNPQRQHLRGSARSEGLEPPTF